MSFLSRFLSYKKICIQCHNNPDADSLASAFGLYRFFCSKGVDSEIVFGGEQVLKKSNTKMLIRECGIPISHNCSPEGYDLLFMVDCQYGQGNAQKFPAPALAIIDHHVPVVDENENFLIKSEYQSCATIIYELLLEENYPVKEDEALAVAFLYGLYTDTSSFADLFYSADIAMRGDLFENQSLFEQLTKSNMSLAELLVASDAMYNHYFDSERRFSIVEALKCDQTVLGMIGDFMIQVDSIFLSFVYTESGDGYQISIRTCHKHLPANQIAAYVCKGIGSGGGHWKKAGGRIDKKRLQERYGDTSVFDVIEKLLRCSIDEVCPGFCIS